MAFQHTQGHSLPFMAYTLGLLRFYYSISGSVSVGVSQKTAVSVFRVSVFT